MQIIYADFFSNYASFSVAAEWESIPGNAHIMAVCDGLKMRESSDQYLLRRLSDAEFYEMLGLISEAALQEKAAWEQLSPGRRLWRSWLSCTGLSDPVRCSISSLMEQKI